MSMPEGCDSSPKDSDRRGKSGEGQEGHREEKSLSLHLRRNGRNPLNRSEFHSCSPHRKIVRCCRLKNCSLKMTNPEHHAAQNIKPSNTQSPSDMAVRKRASTFAAPMVACSAPPSVGIIDSC